MTPEKRTEITAQLADHGLTVLLTTDYKSILIQLARLAQFERLMMIEAECSPWVEVALQRVKAEQVVVIDNHVRPIGILDIPTVQMQVHRAMHECLKKNVNINPQRVDAAVLAFIGILCVEPC